MPAERLLTVFREIISACRALEQSIRVSYLGPEGTFSEQAVRKHFGRAVEGLATASVDEAFRRCESGTAQFTVVPAENSTEGVVGRTLDLLLTTPLRICGEVELRVQQNLLCKSDDIASIKKIYSHAQSLAQCNGWLSQNLPRAERVPVTSNADAARRAAEEAGSAAVAGEAAAERYGLNMLAKGIEDDPNNTTRFLVLGNLDPAPTGKDRTSLVVSAENKPGAVHALLTPLAQHRVSMTRIESRPARTRSALWEYMFFIDVEGHQKDASGGQGARRAQTQSPLTSRCWVPTRQQTETNADGSLRAVPVLRALDRALPARQADLRAGARDGPARSAASSSSPPTRTRAASARARAPRSRRRSATSRATRTATASS